MDPDPGDLKTHGSYGSATQVVTCARVGELPAGGGGLHPVRRYQAVPGGPARGIHPQPAEAARGSSSGGWRGRPSHPALLRLH